MSESFIPPGDSEDIDDPMVAGPADDAAGTDLQDADDEGRTPSSTRQSRRSAPSSGEGDAAPRRSSAATKLLNDEDDERLRDLLADHPELLSALDAAASSRPSIDPNVLSFLDALERDAHGTMRTVASAMGLDLIEKGKGSASGDGERSRGADGRFLKEEDDASSAPPVSSRPSTKLASQTTDLLKTILGDDIGPAILPVLEQIIDARLSQTVGQDIAQIRQQHERETMAALEQTSSTILESFESRHPELRDPAFRREFERVAATYTPADEMDAEDYLSDVLTLTAHRTGRLQARVERESTERIRKGAAEAATSPRRSGAVQPSQVARPADRPVSLKQAMQMAMRDLQSGRSPRA